MSNLRMDCVENLPEALVGAHLLRWIATYPVDKVIHSLNNRGQTPISCWTCGSLGKFEGIPCCLSMYHQHQREAVFKYSVANIT